MNERRFGLRARVIASFAIGALLLSLLLSAVTYSLTQANLVERRTDFAQTSAERNARLINDELTPNTDTARFDTLMSGYITPEGTQQGMLHRGSFTWIDSLNFTDDQLPEAFVDSLFANRAAEMQFHTDGSPYYAVGYPLPNLNTEYRAAVAPTGAAGGAAALEITSTVSPGTLTGVVVDTADQSGRADVSINLVDSSGAIVDTIASGVDGQFVFSGLAPFYVQATPLQDVEDTLNGLLATLLGASAVTTILGAGFGVYVASRLFSPLSEVSEAAAQIAHGDLETRLEEVPDPDLGRLVSSFNEMTSALQERILRDSRFASDVSHELRSPLMTLTGSVAVLEKRRDDMPERAQVALDLLSADIRRFKTLVEDLLEISRFDVGAVVLETEEVLLSEFVRQALFAATSGQRQIPVIHGPNAEDLIVEIDKRRIAQVIRNLSENADKYADGVTQARIERIGDGVRIELEDEGPGVPPDERELIFDRFARGSEGGRRGSGTGVGLGLSLVVEHLRLHGGTIHVDDRVDGLLGARFIVALPAVVVDE